MASPDNPFVSISNRDEKYLCKPTPVLSLRIDNPQWRITLRYERPRDSMWVGIMLRFYVQDVPGTIDSQG